MQSRAGLRELAHRPHEHPRPEVRAADADVDDVGNGLAGCAFEYAPVHFTHETAHALASAARCGPHVAARGEGRGIGARPHLEAGARLAAGGWRAGEHAPDARG